MPCARYGVEYVTEYANLLLPVVNGISALFLNKLGMHCGASSVVIFVGLLDLSILLEYSGQVRID